MGKLSLATIAKSLDEMLDRQMTGQARIAAHLVVAAEAAGCSPSQVITILESVAASTVLDELWITDETGHVYLTNVRDDDGELVPFAFSPDPKVQKQASAFYSLLQEPIGANAVVAQEAQVREIDWQIFKYVGVNGVDKPRIVQVGNALAFEEQGLLTDTYASPVMTAVLGVFGEPELLESSFTTRLPEVHVIFEAILSQQMAVHCMLAAAFIASAGNAGWTEDDINARLRRIAEHSPIAEIYVASHSGAVTHSNVMDAPAMLPRMDAVGPLAAGKVKTIEHAWESEGARACKAVTVFHPEVNRLAQVVEYVKDTALVSPRYVIPVTPD